MPSFRSIALILLVLAVFVCPSVNADTVGDTILFTDTHGVGSETIPPYYIDLSRCSPNCAPFDAYPYSVVGDTIPGTVYIGDRSGYVSDKIVTTFPTDGTCTNAGVPVSCVGYITAVQFLFSSGLDLSSPYTCASVGGCDFIYDGSIQTVGQIDWGPGAFPGSYATTLQFQSQAATFINFQGGTTSAPVLLLGSQPIALITGSIGGEETQDYYTFVWGGGAFSATASVQGADPTSSYAFSEGAPGSCGGGSSITLSSADNFTDTLNIANLPAGQYCIGLQTDGALDPSFTLNFNTEVTGVPEPSAFFLLGIALVSIGTLLRGRHSHKDR